MRSQIGRPKAMTPVKLRRLAGGFHSVAKQALFNIAFGVDLARFLDDSEGCLEEFRRNLLASKWILQDLL